MGKKYIPLKVREKKLQKSRNSLEKIIKKERYLEFKSVIGKLSFFKDITKKLKAKGWEKGEIRLYYDFMILLKEESEIKRLKFKKGYTKSQLDRINKIKENAKGKRFDVSGKQIERIQVVSGGSPSLGKKK